MKSIEYEYSNKSITITVNFSSSEKGTFYVFNPPNGSVYAKEKAIESGDNSVKVQIKLSAIMKGQKMTMKFCNSQFSGFLFIDMSPFNSLWNSKDLFGEQVFK